jgi:hypothetical protein
MLGLEKILACRAVEQRELSAYRLRNLVTSERLVERPLIVTT